MKCQQQPAATSECKNLETSKDPNKKRLELLDAGLDFN